MAGPILSIIVFLVASNAPKEQLVPFDPKRSAGLWPEMLANEDRGDYFLRYVLSGDGAGVRMRFLGLSEALSAGFGTREEIAGGEHVLLGTMGWSGFRVPIARWSIDAHGRAVDIRVRTEPVVEIRRWRDREGGELVAPCEWRPWIDGRGFGAWRR